MSAEQLNIRITATDDASPVVKALIGDLQRLSRLAGNISGGIVKNLSGLNAGKAMRDDLTKSQTEAMRGLRQRFTFEDRMVRQRIAGERAVAREEARTARQRDQEARRQDQARRIGESATMRQFRQQMRFTQAMARQQAQIEREAERSRARAERDRAAAVRRQIGLDNYRFALRERSERREATAQRRAQADEDRHRRSETRQRNQAHRDLRRSAGHVGDARGHVMDGARTVTVYSAIGAGILGKIAETGLRSRSSADTAEANLRMFGGQTRAQVEAHRSGWLNSAAVENGFRPMDAINAFTETLKAGIPDAVAPTVTRSIMGASAGLDLNVADTTKLVGRLSTLTQDPKFFQAGEIDRMLNGIAVVAKVTAADSRELVSSLRRGAGVLGSSKMSVNDLTAFTGIGISAGMQEGKAGTFMDFLVNDLVNAKNSRGQRRADLDRSFGLLGLGSAGAVSHQAANDPTKLLLRMFERMSTMAPEKAGQVASLIGMREWRGEMLMMMKGVPMLRQTIEAGRDPKNANHLAQARDERLGTLAGLMSQIRATADLAWEAVGGGLEDIVRDIGRFFVNFGKTMKLDVFKAHVRTLLDGFIDGLGFANVTEMLERIFGKPGDMNFSKLNSFFGFAQGFGRGVREVIDAVMSVVSAFAGKDATAETLGLLTARIMGFSVVLATISPFVGVIAGLGAALLGLGYAAFGLSKALRGFGLVGGAGAAAGAAGSAGTGTGTGAAAGAAAGGAAAGRAAGLLGRFAGGAGLGAAATAGAYRGEISTWLLRRVLPDWWQNALGWNEAEKKPASGGSVRAWTDPPAKPLPSDPAGTKALAKKAADAAAKPAPTGLDPASDLRDSMDRLRESVDRLTIGSHGLASRIATADALSRPASLVRASFSNGSEAIGGIGGPRSSAGGNLIRPDGMNVPGWYGRGSGGANPGGGTASSAPGRGSANHMQGQYGAPGSNLTTVTTASGKRATVHKAASANFQGFLNELEASGYKINSLGGFNHRNIRGGNKLSQHAYGNAIDINPAQNPMGSRLITDMPKNISDMAVKWGITWGGDWKRRPDAMHFEWNGKTLDQLRKEHAGGAGIGAVASNTIGSLTGVIERAAAAAGIDPRIMHGIRAGESGHRADYDRNVTPREESYGPFQLNRKGGLGQVFERETGLDLKDPRTIQRQAEWVARHIRKRLQANPGYNPRSEWYGYKGLMQSDPRWGNSGLVVGSPGRDVADNLNRMATSARKAQMMDIGGGMKSTGWEKADPRNIARAAEGVPSAERAIQNVPLPPRRPQSLGDGAGGGNAVHVTQHIHGYDKSPAQIAALAQRKITEDWNHRAHDLEPELT